MSTSGWVTCIAGFFAILTFMGSSPKTGKKLLLYSILRLILLVFIVVPGIMWFKGYPDSYDGTKQAINYFIEKIESIFSQEPTEEETGDEESDDPTSEIIIDANQVEDFSKSLVPKYFYRYISSTDKFNFRYPNSLYNQVESNTESFITDIGENIETHKFTGSAGSVLSFSLLKRIDNNGLLKQIIKVKEYEQKEIADSYKMLLPYQIENGEIRTVITGRNNVGRILYVFIMVDAEHIMDMHIECPDYRDYEDEMMKRYVQECIYRYCGFKGSKVGNPRSYEEFLKSDKK